MNDKYNFFDLEKNHRRNNNGTYFIFRKWKNIKI